MSVYIIVSYDIKDAEIFKDYVPAIRPLFVKHGAEVIVAEYDAKPIEGERRSAYIVLKFKSEEAAMGFYNDPEYGPVKKIRLDSCVNNNVVLAREFVPRNNV